MIRGSLTRKHEGQGFRGDLQSRAVSHQRFQCAEVTLSQTPRTDCTLNNFADQSLQMQKLRNEQILKRKRKIQRFYHYATATYLLRFFLRRRRWHIKVLAKFGLHCLESVSAITSKKNHSFLIIIPIHQSGGIYIVQAPTIVLHSSHNISLLQY